MLEEKLARISPKFETVMVGGEIPSDPRLDKLKYWCRIFDKKSLAPPYDGGSYGNLSFRLRENELPFIITGTSIGLKDKLGDDCFVRVNYVDFSNRKVYALGTREPSSEAMVHAAVYGLNPSVNAIFHGHYQPFLDMAERLKIPVTAKEKPYGTIELVEQVHNLLLSFELCLNFFIMRKHGFVALGRTMREAGELTLDFCSRAEEHK